jgi:hypothetical protein
MACIMLVIAGRPSISAAAWACCAAGNSVTRGHGRLEMPGAQAVSSTIALSSASSGLSFMSSLLFMLRGFHRHRLPRVVRRIHPQPGQRSHNGHGRAHRDAHA